MKILLLLLLLMLFCGCASTDPWRTREDWIFKNASGKCLDKNGMLHREQLSADCNSRLYWGFYDTTPHCWVMRKVGNEWVRYDASIRDTRDFHYRAEGYLVNKAGKNPMIRCVWKVDFED